MNFCVYIKPWPIGSCCMSCSGALTRGALLAGTDLRHSLVQHHACAFQAIVLTYVTRLRLCRAPAPRACACAARQKRTRHFKYPSADLGCHLFLPRPQGLFRRGCRLGLQMRDLKNYTQKYRYDTQYTHFTQKFIFYAKIIFGF